MGTLWRSELMELVQIYVQIESARETVDELGNIGCIQFRDVRLLFFSFLFFNVSVFIELIFVFIFLFVP